MMPGKGAIVGVVPLSSLVKGTIPSLAFPPKTFGQFCDVRLLASGLPDSPPHQFLSNAAVQRDASEQS